MPRVLSALLLLCAALCATGLGQRPPMLGAVDELRPLTAEDRLLIIAPHEDDETIAAGGLIQAALRAGATLDIVYLTYGDHNEWSFLVYKKRLLLSPAFNRRMGEERRREAIAAMRSLGVDPQRLHFLGYPDSDLLKIWRQHWGGAPPLHSLLTNATVVPYPDAVAFQLPHTGEAILGDLARILRDARPTKIVITHPADSHPDHQAAYLFLRVALLELADVIPPPVVYAAPIHHGRWPIPKRFAPEAPLTPPPRLAGAPIRWTIYRLPSEDVLRKDAAIRRYKSQTSYSGPWLRSFARANELFGDYPLVDLRGDAATPPAPEAWSETFLPTPETTTYEEMTVGADAVLTYRAVPEGLELRARFRDRTDESFGLTARLFGYRHDRSFAQMPKLQLRLRAGRCTVLDQQRPLDGRAVRWRHEGRGIVFTVPSSLLGTAELLFVQARAQVRDTAVQQTAWRVLLLRTPPAPRPSDAVPAP